MCPSEGSNIMPCCGKTPFEAKTGDQMTLQKKLVTCYEKTQHNWPGPGEHLWGDWMTLTGLPKPEQYRVCVDPRCSAKETRKAPSA